MCAWVCQESKNMMKSSQKEQVIKRSREGRPALETHTHTHTHIHTHTYTNGPTDMYPPCCEGKIFAHFQAGHGSCLPSVSAKVFSSRRCGGQQCEAHSHCAVRACSVRVCVCVWFTAMTSDGSKKQYLTGSTVPLFRSTLVISPAVVRVRASFRCLCSVTPTIGCCAEQSTGEGGGEMGNGTKERN